MKKKYKRPKRIYNGSCKRSYMGRADCIVYFKKGRIFCVKYPDGTKIYLKNNKVHREDGPALITETGRLKYWYLEDIFIPVKSQKEFNKYLRLKELRAFK